MMNRLHDFNEYHLVKFLPLPIEVHRVYESQSRISNNIFSVLEKQLEISVGVELFYRSETKNILNIMTTKLNEHLAKQ